MGLPPMPIEIKVVRTRSGIRNAFARMPFRFGVITMRAAPLFTLAAEVEDGRGACATGYAADFLAYRWFDKRPEKSLSDNCADLLRAVATAQALYLEAGEEGLASPFELWRHTHPEIERRALGSGCNRLGAGFGSSMLERAVIDGVGRLTGRSYFELVRDDLLGIELGAITPALQGRPMRAFLPAQPLDRLHVRHTVGLLDPITAADLEAPVADGLPETLEHYLERDGIRFLKIKIGGALAADLARLQAIAAVLERHDRRFAITLDGNEQYKALDDFLALVEAIKAAPALRRLWGQILFIEQPLDRELALEPGVEAALRDLGRNKPVIIDEADDRVSAFKEAARLGYRGVSHKNCKGIYKSLHNLALAATHNARVGRAELFLSAEDLSNLPVVPLQADLASVALLGITHVERNGHHYFRGLGHLSAAEKTAALAAHPDLYERRAGEVLLRITEGMLACASLQVPGMGFAAPPDMAAMTPVEDWNFESLGPDA
jgi:Enolase C-terminal domain-like